MAITWLISRHKKQRKEGAGNRKGGIALRRGCVDSEGEVEKKSDDI
jgi:hypothetical protein